MATAIVLAGAGARGAYEAGVLSVVMPVLLAEEREVILLGTSAGAINVAILAAAAYQESSIAQRLQAMWTRLDHKEVFDLEPIRLGFGLAKFFVHGKRKEHPYSLLNAEALSRAIDGNEHVDWDTLRKNIGSTWVKAAGVVATHVATGRSFVFVHGLDRLPPSNTERGIEYVPTALEGKHVLASAAIPMAFRSVRITIPGGNPSRPMFFSDGGTRLNTPIKPAADMLRTLNGAVKRLVIVSTHPDPNRVTVGPVTTSGAPNEDEPDIIDEASSILRSVFVDRVAEDVRHLRRRNQIIDSATGGRPVTTDDGKTYEVIPHAYFGPPESGHIADAARDVFRQKYRRLSLKDFSLISRSLGGESASRNELLSFLFFDREYLSAIFELGRNHACEQLKSGIPWVPRLSDR